MTTIPTFVNVFRGSSNQSIATATWTTILFNVIETDGSSNVLYTSNNGQFIAPESGWYDIEAQVTWASSIIAALRIIRNGNTSLPAFIQSRAAAQNLSTIKLRLFMGENEYVQVQAYQATGGPIDIVPTTTLVAPARSTSGTFTLIKPSPSVTFNGF